MKTRPQWLRDRFDGAADKDLFGFSATAELLARQIQQLAPGTAEGALIVSIEGPWGSGKTTLAHMLWRAVAETQRGGPPPLRVHFNAWLSVPGETSAWAALAERVGAALYEGLRTRIRGEATITLPSPRTPGQTFDLDVDFPDDRRYHWRELAWSLSKAVPSEHWHPCLNLFCDAPSKLAGRGLSTAQGLRSMVDVGLAGWKAMSDPLAAAGELAGVGRTLVDAQRAQLHQVPPESQEFVARLQCLLRVLAPSGPWPRLWLEVEDVSRLDETRLEHMLAALAYLQELDGAAVVMSVDREQADALVARATRGAGGEGALVRTIHLRQRVPEVLLRHINALVELWTQTLGLGPDADRTMSNQLTDLWHDCGLRSPRQVKRGLVWLDERVVALRHAAGAPDEAAIRPQLLALAAVYVHYEGLLDSDGLGRELDDLGPTALTAMPSQLWSARAWPDGVKHQPQDAAGLDLLWRTRWLELLAQVDGDRELLQRGRADLAVAYEAWRAAAAHARWGAALKDFPTGPQAPALVQVMVIDGLLARFDRVADRRTISLSAGVMREAALELFGDPTAVVPAGVAQLLARWPERDAFEFAAADWPQPAAALARGLGAVLHGMEAGDLGALEPQVRQAFENLARLRDAPLADRDQPPPTNGEDLR